MLVFTGVWDDGRKDIFCFRGADRCIWPGQITPSIFESARSFHYGSITLIDEPGASAQRKAAQIAHERGLMITYDPNYRPTLWPDENTARRVMLDGFKLAHMAKISEEEFAVVTGHDDLEDGIRSVLDQGVEILIISRGENGALATNGDFIVESPALTGIDIVETTGAGDGFMAAMIIRMLPEFEKNGGSLRNVDKDTVRSALDYANVVGGLTCIKVGAIPALPTAKEVEDFLLMHQRQNKLHSTPLTSLVLSDEVKKLARMIDHTLLKSYVGEPEDLEQLCREASRYEFNMVAVNPAQVEICCKLLQGTNVQVGAAIGFPLGQTTTAVKVYETRDAIERGATEIDMVINVRELQKKNYNLVRSEIESVVAICRKFGKSRSIKIICKVILETCYLTKEEKFRACELCRDAGVDYVKTSTGMGSGGATVNDIKLMRETVGNEVGVKASGGIRDLATAKAMIEAGANRIGTSSGVSIIEELIKEEARVI